MVVVRAQIELERDRLRSPRPAATRSRWSGQRHVRRRASCSPRVRTNTVARRGTLRIGDDLDVERDRIADLLAARHVTSMPGAARSASRTSSNTNVAFGESL